MKANLQQSLPEQPNNGVAKEFEEYAYSVSHDLSGPVRAMVEFSKLLVAEQSAALSEEGREYLTLIIENGEKMQAMMAGLLQYSRLNTMMKPMAPVDMNWIWSDCCRILSDAITKTRAKLESGPLPTINADHEQILLLLQLLLENALKYQPAGNIAHISLHAEDKGDYWQFALVDNGIGIAYHHRERIFKMFQRLHTDAEYPGVGLGLSLARKIVHRHGGEIWAAAPTDNSGSILYFTLLKC